MTKHQFYRSPTAADRTPTAGSFIERDLCCDISIVLVVPLCVCCIVLVGRSAIGRTGQSVETPWRGLAECPVRLLGLLLYRQNWAVRKVFLLGGANFVVKFEKTGEQMSLVT
ncbi:hypothetical protein Q1695_009404 [Nippostrongylus brasiliensis]|nr:hypothetical protein Q1695_009404 [Nippostrongylus brasiliensis]